jgi:tetratricopeptide (TPR) repeat protein
MPMRSSSGTVWLSFALLAASCAGGCGSGRPQSRSTPLAATRPVRVDPALLTIDQIQPRPELPRPRPATRPSHPPLAALQLYAQARAQMDRSPTAAIALLRRALELDPESFWLCYDLGSAYARHQLGVEQALKWLEKAATIEPDHAEAQLAIGKLLMTRGDFAGATRRLRLAVQTTGYRRSPGMAVLVDRMLAMALQQQGYETAALECYQRVLARLDERLWARGNPDLYFLLSRPESIQLSAAHLYERRGRLQEALGLYEALASREPGNFEYAARVVRVRLAVGEHRKAAAMASRLVAEHRACRESVELLRRVHQHVGGEAAVAAELKRILTGRPGDHLMAIAVAEALLAAGQPIDAAAVLEQVRAAPSAEPQRLAATAKLYRALDQQEIAEELLRRALWLEPRCAPANHGLAALLADAGRELTEAESLARLALETEPDNVAFLDSLGWVLYKQGRFDLAREQLLKAVERAEKPDAVALDHLGDVLYRLGRPAEALASWRRSLGHLKATPDPGRAALVPRLESKIRQHQAGEPVSVAPVPDAAPVTGRTIGAAAPAAAN